MFFPNDGDEKMLNETLIILTKYTNRASDYALKGKNSTSA